MSREHMSNMAECLTTKGSHDKGGSKRKAKLQALSG